MRLQNDANESALLGARRSADLLVTSTFGGLVVPGDLRGQLTPTRHAALDRAAARAKRAGGIARIKIWTPGGRIAYSDDTAIIGHRFEVEEDLREALKGREQADIT